MSFRFICAGVALAAAASLVGCRTSSSSTKAAPASGAMRWSQPGQLKAEAATGIVDLRSERGPGSTEAVYERAVALATTSEAKVRALVALGHAQLELIRIQPALKSFYEARRLSYQGGMSASITALVNGGLGDAYLASGDFALAGRYLAKAAEEARGRERDLLNAKLVVVSRDLNDLDAATRYRGRLSQPISPEVRQILDRGLRKAPQLARAGMPAGGDEDEDADLGARTPANSPPASSGEKLRIFSRASWNARSPHKNIEPMGRVDKITVHHSGGDDVWSSSEADTAEEIRKIQRYHQKEQGWADIGYHYVIDRTGAIWQGRRLRYQGAHARGSANHGNVGIVLLGNYVHQSVSRAQKDSLELLLETLCEHFSVPAGSVYTHREILGGKTDCPGPALTQCVKEIRARLQKRLVAYKP